MKCEEANVLMHALIDGELDAGHAREVEAHIAGCPDCAARLREFQELRKMMTPEGLRYSAPASLRARIEGKLPAPAVTMTSRRSAIKGFAFGAGASAIAASGLLLMVMQGDEQKRILENKPKSAKRLEYERIYGQRGFPLSHDNGIRYTFSLSHH